MLIEVTENDENRIWKPGYLRLFISHTATSREMASEIKEALDTYGVTCFVAHLDITPTLEWLDEIQRALISADMVLAMLTDDFGNSIWTDQEVGVALGLDKWIIPLSLRTAPPHGFIARYQSVPGREADPPRIAQGVYEAIFSKPEIHDRVVQTLVNAFVASQNYTQANTLIDYLERVEEVDAEAIERLNQAFETNSQVYNAYKVKRLLPALIERFEEALYW